MRQEQLPSQVGCETKKGKHKKTVSKQQWKEAGKSGVETGVV